ncbi:MAG: hypothetical protein WDN06_17110 [Asticcacaulis sp.]
MQSSVSFTLGNFIENLTLTGLDAVSGNRQQPGQHPHRQQRRQYAQRRRRATTC